MPQINIRWADNTAELRARLKEGVGALDAMKASVEKTVQAMGGQGLFRAAHNVTAAIIEMGGATKLTAAEQQRHLVLLDKAIEKYRVMGQTVPPILQQIANEMRQANQPLSNMVAGMTAAGKVSVESAKMIAGMGQAGTIAAANLAKVNPPLSSMVAGMTAAGKVSVESSRMIAGMSASGQTAMTALAASAVKVQGPLTSILGLARQLGPALGIGFGVGAVVGFGKAIIADADALVKMSDKTGISVQGLQKFRVAADDAGNTLDQLTTATNQMQNRLAGNDQSAVAAIQKLGLNLADLKRMAPDQQFMAIAEAIRSIKDPAEQVNVAMDIFGRSGAEILPTIKRGFDDVRDSAVGMSDEAVKALDEFGDSLVRTGREAKGFFGEVLAGILAEKKAFQDAADEYANRAGKPTGPQRTFLTPLEQASMNAPRPTAPFSVAAPGIPENLDAIIKSLNSQLASLNVNAAAIKKLHEAWEEYRSIAGSVHKQLSGDTIEGIKFDLARGHSQSTLATIYGVTATQIKAVADEMERLNKFQDAARNPLAGFTLTPGLQMQTGLLTGVGKLAHEMSLLIPTFKNLDKIGVQTFSNIRETIGLTNDQFKELRASWQTTGELLSDVFKGIPDLLIKAFTGGGGILGAAKAIGVQLADAFLKPTKDGLSTITKMALVTGATVGAGAVAAGAGWQSAMGQVGLAAAGVATTAGLATGATVAGTVALGAMTLGIGAAAVGVALLIKKFMGVEKAIKDARKAQEEFRETLWATLTPAQLLEGGNEAWKLDVIAVRDAYIATGRSAADALKIVEALWDTDHPERMAAAMREITAVLKEQAAQWDGVQESVSDLNAFVKDGIDSQGKYNIAVGSAVAIFDAWVKKTGDVAGALQQIGPSLDAIALSQKDLGFAGNAAIEQLLGLRKVTEANKPLMENIGQSTRLLQSLGKAGLLTEDLLMSFGQNAVNQFTLLKSATGNAKQAMVLMQPELQALWEHQQKFGKFADEATQALIDEAEVSGVVGQEMKSVNQQVLDVLKAIAKVLGAEIPAAAERAADGIIDNLGNIDVDVDVNYHHNNSGALNFDDQNIYASTGGLVGRLGLQSLRTPQYLSLGGMAGMQSIFQPRGTDVYPAMLSKGETVRTVAQEGANSTALMELATAAAAASGRSSSPVVVKMYLDQREVGSALIDYTTHQVARGTSEGTRLKQVLRGPG